MKLELINTLCESRMFRTQAALSSFSPAEKDTLFYAYFLAVIGLALDTKTSIWARQYAGKTAAFSNFDFFRTTATDFYVLAYDVYKRKGQAWVSQRQIINILKGISKGESDRSDVEYILLRLEKSLGIGGSLSGSKLRAARRTVLDWMSAGEANRHTALSDLYRIIKQGSSLAEILPYILILTKRAPGHFGSDPDSWGVAKTAAAIAGTALAGLGLGIASGYKGKYRVFDSKDDPRTVLDESRPTHLLKMVSSIERMPEVEKLIDVHYLADGITAFVRTKDGNAYEFEVRPAKYAKGHNVYRKKRIKESELPVKQEVVISELDFEELENQLRNEAGFEPEDAILWVRPLGNGNILINFSNSVAYSYGIDFEVPTHLGERNGNHAAHIVIKPTDAKHPDDDGAVERSPKDKDVKKNLKQVAKDYDVHYVKDFNKYTKKS